MAAQERTMPFIKNLASSDRKIRTTALASLQTFLSARQVASALAPLDVLKLWKGLFYALWMCDRAVPQQTLCAELAELVYILPRGAVVPWLRGFWSTMAREWTSIDVLRMEKFLLLVRRVLGASFRWMKGASGKGGKEGTGAWDAERVDDVLTLLKEWPFALELETQANQSPEEGEEHELDPLAPQNSIPVGMKLHVLDIWVDEAEKMGMLETEDEKAAKVLQRISNQVDLLEQGTISPAVRFRSKESLADDRLPGNKKLPEAGKAASGNADADMDGSEDGGSWDGFND
ncbi:nucleolar protein,Nop52-domain-containing protein [Bombardia bombarda]|uniref:Nucleolar protein,Nop52-domain-containing protein n=1 Tax=Bombardia bombarda TaxID=252184 RepID=A0AA39WU85_9PEZI|nr:nucleolar protein,Nop52-domain-containing protein [Bombardia bombarda]